MNKQQLKGAFPGCTWCGGNGCMMCDQEREKAIERAQQPIFTADRNNEGDMAQLKEILGIDALNHAFGPDGGGVQEIRENAAIASLTQFFRKQLEARELEEQSQAMDAAMDEVAEGRPPEVMPEDYHE